MLLQGSNLDSPGSEPGVLPITPRSRVIDEIRTRSLRGHVPALIQMSFNHHETSALTGRESNPHAGG